MLPTIASLSRISLVMTRLSLPKCSRRSLMNCPDPYGDSTWPYANMFARGRSFCLRMSTHERVSSIDQLSPSEKWNG